MRSARVAWLASDQMLKRWRNCNSNASAQVFHSQARKLNSATVARQVWHHLAQTFTILLSEKEGAFRIAAVAQNDDHYSRQEKIGMDWDSSSEETLRSLSSRTTRPKRLFKLYQICDYISFRTWCARSSFESLAWSAFCTCRTCKSFSLAASATDPEILL